MIRLLHLTDIYRNLQNHHLIVKELANVSDFYLQKLQLIKGQVLDRNLDKLLSLVIFLSKSRKILIVPIEFEDEVREPKNLNFTILVDMQHVRSW